MQVLIFMMLIIVTTVELQPNHGAKGEVNLPHRIISTKRDVNLRCTVGSYFSILDGCKREIVENNSLVRY